MLPNNRSMPGGLLNLMRTQTNRLLCFEDESGCGNTKLWRNATSREF